MERRATHNEDAETRAVESQLAISRWKAPRMAWTVLVMALFALVLTGVPASSAYAHDTGTVRHYYNGYPVASGRVYDGHNLVRSCDLRSDGYGTYVKVWLANGENPSVGDSNGAASGCDYRKYGSRIEKFKVCINNSWWRDSCTEVRA